MKMLVTLDGSKVSEEVLPLAAQMATAKDVQVQLLSVIREEDIHGSGHNIYTPEYLRGTVDASGGLLRPSVPPNLATESIGANEERLRAERTEYLRDIAHDHFPNGAEVEVTKGEHVDRHIEEYAGSHGVGLIAIASHGRSGIGKLLMGSVADHIVKHSATPVLLVRCHK